MLLAKRLLGTQVRGGDREMNRPAPPRSVLDLNLRLTVIYEYEALSEGE